MEAGAEWKLPQAKAPVSRMLYFYRGESISLNDTTMQQDQAAELNPHTDVIITNGNRDSYIFLLQGLPIEEPVVSYGPFVMNTEEEIRQAISDYRKTEFGGWPWPRPDMIHQDRGRFAKYKDDREELK